MAITKEAAEDANHVTQTLLKYGAKAGDMLFVRKCRELKLSRAAVVMFSDLVMLIYHKQKGEEDVKNYSGVQH